MLDWWNRQVNRVLKAFITLMQLTSQIFPNAAPSRAGEPHLSAAAASMRVLKQQRAAAT